jgi:hypothetical protein
MHAGLDLLEANLADTQDSLDGDEPSAFDFAEGRDSWYEAAS